MAQEDEEYEIEDIVGVKKNRGKFFFRVRWFGYKPEEDTWEPEQNLKHLTKFRKKMATFKDELITEIELKKKNGKRFTPKIDRGSSSNISRNDSYSSKTSKGGDSVGGVSLNKQRTRISGRNYKSKDVGNREKILKKRTRQNEKRIINYNYSRNLKDGIVVKNKSNNGRMISHKDNENMVNIANYNKKKRENKNIEETNEAFFNDSNINTRNKRKRVMKSKENDTVDIEKTYIGEKRKKENEKNDVNVINSVSSETSSRETTRSLNNYTAIQSTTTNTTKKLLSVEDIYGVRCGSDDIQYMACITNNKAMWLLEDEIEKTPHIVAKLRDYKNYILQETKEEDLEITIKNMHTIGDELYLSVILNLGNGEEIQSLYPSRVVEYIYPHEYIKFLFSKLRFGI